MIFFLKIRNLHIKIKQYLSSEAERGHHTNQGDRTFSTFFFNGIDLKLTINKTRRKIITIISIH